MGAIFDRVAMTLASAPGTGDLILGVARDEGRTWAAAGAVAAQVVNYVIKDPTDDATWEIGEGTYRTGPARIERTTIIASSNGGSAITATASMIVYSDAFVANFSPAVGSITGLGTGVAAALAIELNAAGGLVGYSALGSAAFLASSAFDATGTAASAVASHAALQTGVHGISVTAGKTLAATNSLTLAGTDGSTLGIGTGGTLAALAFKASAAIGADVSGLGTGVAAALAINVGSAGAPVLFDGALGTPSSATLTNASGLPVSGLAAVAASSLLGNNTGGAASPSALTGAQATALLSNVTGDSGSGGAKGLVPAPAAGDAAAAKFLKADGTWATPASSGSPAGSSGQFQYNASGSFGAVNFWREDANTIAQRNSTTAQSSYIYNTYTDAANYERALLGWSSNKFIIGTEKAGTGSARQTQIWQDGKPIFQVVPALTTFNTFIGVDAGPSATASDNLGIGNKALFACGLGNGNIALGAFALTALTSGANNVAIGREAIGSSTAPARATAIGARALGYNTAASDCVAIGLSAGEGAASYSSEGSTIIGSYAGGLLGTGSDYNTLIGYSAGYGITTGPRNVLIGPASIAASYDQVTTGSRNISIGNDVAVASATANDQLCIGNLIYGTALDGTGSTISSGKIGIGVKAPSYKLEVNGTFGISDNMTIADAKNVIVGSTTGTKIGTATTQKLGFYNATPVVQPAALTAELTSITHTAPGTPDYALQDLTDTGGFGFATKDEGNTVLSVILNLQTRVNELETKLQALGLIA